VARVESDRSDVREREGIAYPSNKAIKAMASTRVAAPVARTAALPGWHVTLGFVGAAAGLQREWGGAGLPDMFPGNLLLATWLPRCAL
jgi:hypothetical protein